MKRRMLSSVLAIMVLHTFVSSAVGATTNVPGAKPNIVIVITDDQGTGDLACMGNPYIKTPNIDRFYTDAIRFTNYHVSTTCAPTRGALMSGRHTNRINTYHTISGRSLLFEDEVILPQIFGQNGYVNGMFGKWHLGDNYPYRPEDRGFQEVVRLGGGGISQGPDYWGNDYFDDTYWHNGTPQKYTGYCTDVFFDEALRFIEDNRDRPFFCYLATNAPHGPLNVPEAYLNIYQDVDGLKEKVKRFYGMITNIDDNFKRLEDKLVAHYDLLPTFVDLLGLDFNPVKPLDGKSLKPLLYDAHADWPQRILYMDTQRLQNLVKYRKYSVMDEDWRLVDGDELYDMHVDLSQTTNVIGPHPEVARRLAVGYEKWWQSFLDEGVDERYAYIKVGSPKENPSRICAHDLLTGKVGQIWHQYGAVNASPGSGRWKIEFVTGGQYAISLRRFPRESGLAINATFPAHEKPIELERAMPASTKSDFDTAYLYVAGVAGSRKIGAGQQEVTFTGYIPTGKYDMEAQLIDMDKRVYPAYYVYIDKL